MTAPTLEYRQLPNYSTSWKEGGPIMERERIGFLPDCSKFWACKSNGPNAGRRFYGKTPLEAAMRCFVRDRLGKEIELPSQLAEETV